MRRSAVGISGIQLLGNPDLRVKGVQFGVADKLKTQFVLTADTFIIITLDLANMSTPPNTRKRPDIQQKSHSSPQSQPQPPPSVSEALRKRSIWQSYAGALIWL